VRRLLLLTAVAATALTAGAASSEASCIATMRWHGRPYLGYAKAAETAGVLPDKAIQPGCNDVITNGEPRKERSSAVKVRQVRGVDPLIAFADRDWTYVNGSTFVNQANHPLHALLGSDEVPSRAGKECRVTGTAVVDAFGVSVKHGKRVTPVIAAADTVIELQRRGTGYVADGARIVVVARPCHAHFLNAVRVSRAP
jgi:hypothetical protein